MGLLKSTLVKELDRATRGILAADEAIVRCERSIAEVDGAIERVREAIRLKNDELADLVHSGKELAQVELQSRVLLNERQADETWLKQQQANRSALLSRLASLKVSALDSERGAIDSLAAAYDAEQQRCLEAFLEAALKPYRDLCVATMNLRYLNAIKSRQPETQAQMAAASVRVHGMAEVIGMALKERAAADVHAPAMPQPLRASNVSSAERLAVSDGRGNDRASAILRLFTAAAKQEQQQLSIGSAEFGRLANRQSELLIEVRGHESTLNSLRYDYGVLEKAREGSGKAKLKTIEHFEDRLKAAKESLERVTARLDEARSPSLSHVA